MDKFLKNNAKKKVLFLITKSNWGGAQRYVYDLATNLDRNKFLPIVALGGNGPLLTMLQNVGIPVIHLPEMQNCTSLRQAGRNYRELLSMLQSEKPDVLHLNSSIAGLLGAIAGRYTKVPSVLFTAHGWAFNEDRPQWQKITLKLLHYFAVLLSHRTIAVSSAIVAQMNWPGVQSRMKIINPGRTIGAMYNRDEARAKIIDFCPLLTPFVTAYWIVCIAELHPIKRHHVLIDAFAEHIKNNSNQILILIGEGSERSSLEHQIKKLNLTNQVLLLGTIIEAGRFLKAFDTFVLASKSESYGYVLHEAGIAGIPIIATNVGGIPDIIHTPDEGLLIKPDDSTALITALTDVIRNPLTAQKRAITLQKKLLNRTVAKMTRQTESLYLT